MSTYQRKEQLPPLPEWMKRYDISVGPYVQPVPPSPPQQGEERQDEQQRRQESLEDRT